MICWFAGRGGFDCGSWNLWTLHHVVPKQVIKRRFPYGALYDGTPAAKWSWKDVPVISQAHLLEDERNLVPACGDHHDRWHNARFKVSRDELPESVGEFAADYGFEPWLERTFGGPVPKGRAA